MGDLPLRMMAYDELESATSAGLKGGGLGGKGFFGGKGGKGGGKAGPAFYNPKISYSELIHNELRRLQAEPETADLSKLFFPIKEFPEYGIATIIDQTWQDCPADKALN